MTKPIFWKTLQSFVVIPILATNFTFGSLGLAKLPTAVVSSTGQNGPQIVESADNHQLELEEMAKRIDGYFENIDSPLAGHGTQFVTQADKNDLPLTLLAAQGMQESTACKFIVPGTNNCWGWGNGKVHFDSIDQAIEQISANLGGNDKDTEHWYKDKTVEEILKIYNPPHVGDPNYTRKILWIMNAIENYPIQ